MSLEQIRLNFIHYLQEHNLLKTSVPLSDDGQTSKIITENFEYFKKV